MKVLKRGFSTVQLASENCWLYALFRRINLFEVLAEASGIDASSVEADAVDWTEEDIHTYFESRGVYVPTKAADPLVVVYGAYGYTAELIVHHALERGFTKRVRTSRSPAWPDLLLVQRVADPRAGGKRTLCCCCFCIRARVSALQPVRRGVRHHVDVQARLRLAGRDEAKLRGLANSISDPKVEAVACSLQDPDALDRLLVGAVLVLHAAGARTHRRC